MVTRIAALLMASTLVMACWTEVRPAPPAVEPGAGATSDEGDPVAAPGATAPPTAAVAPENVDAEELAPPLPSITFTDLKGASKGSVERWFQATPEMLSRCKGAKGNTVRVYVSARDGHVHASLDETDASASTTSCALETIAFQLDNVLAPSVSPSERTHPVESMIILDW